METSSIETPMETPPMETSPSTSSNNMSRLQHVHLLLHRLVPHKPRTHWFAVYVALLLYFFFSRISIVPSLLDMFADDAERGAGLQMLAVLLGSMEDILLITYLCAILVLFELITRWIAIQCDKVPLVQNSAVVQRVLMVIGRVLHAIVILFLLVITIAPFAADRTLIDTRQSRFTFDLIAMYNRDKANAGDFKIDSSESAAVKRTVAITVLVVFVYGMLYIGWIDLTLWVLGTPSTRKSSFNQLEDGDSTVSEVDVQMKSVVKRSSVDEIGDASRPNASIAYHGMEEWKKSAHPTSVKEYAIEWYITVHDQVQTHRRVVLVVLMALLMVFIIPSIFISITHVMSVALSNVALNTTLNELFFAIMDVTFLTKEGSGSLATGLGKDDHPYIHSKTESFTLLGPEGSLYRTTTGFKGPLAFDMRVDPTNPPNVLVIMVESFRARDSLYLSGETSAGALLKQYNISVTPNFDRWAKRGIAFNNTWSSWQTSRSLESMNYAQLPYDDPDETGTTGGRTKTVLAGMPQFFKQKGYDVSFSASSRVNYDGWDTFLPSHGYETVVSSNDYKQLAIEKLGLTAQDFTAAKTKNARDMYWGVHDDISLPLLGDALIEKVEDQQQRVQNNEPKQPFFITHYMISSHVPYDCVPQWFEDEMTKAGELKQFDVLSAKEEYKSIIDAYMKLRYFSDIQLGLFLDRMEKEGVLKDTIVVIAGDHGQGPEKGYSKPYDAQQSVTHVAAAMIAEGHLAMKDRGLVISDAVEHYDFLNTLADIVGVPPGGFEQVGVGRSLKRKVPFGDRLVYSNNPMKKMSIVRGTKRFVYDKVSKAVSMHDLETDDEMKIDLFPTLSKQEQKEWLTRREAGRALSLYFKKKMDDGCVAEARCM